MKLIFSDGSLSLISRVVLPEQLRPWMSILPLIFSCLAKYRCHDDNGDAKDDADDGDDAELPMMMMMMMIMMMGATVVGLCDEFDVGL